MYNCEYCGKEFPRPVTSGHKRKCPEFIAVNPLDKRKPPTCLCGHSENSYTSMKRHRVTCEIWKTRDKNQVANERIVATFQKKYGPGVTNAIHIPESRKKKEETNLKKYGAKNTFCKESTLYKQVQSHWEGKDRSAHLDKNNWARPEVKAKIKETNLKKYGVENVSQNPEIRAKQLATSKDRYGDEHSLRVPEIRAKGIITLLDRYGVTNPMKNEELVNKVRETNMQRYGVDWTTQNYEVLSRLKESHFNKFGSWYGATKEWKEQFYDQVDKMQERIRETNIKRYGVGHPMQNPDYARNQLQHSRRSGPNSLERKLQSHFPQFLFTGDGSYWRYLPSLGKNKNPDFIFRGPDPLNPFHDTHSVLEIFGDYWHSERFTQMSNKDHEFITVSAWKEVGINCLVIWESEFKSENWQRKVQDYLGKINNTKLLINNPPIGVKRDQSLESLALVDFSFADVTFVTLNDIDIPRTFLDSYHYAGFGRGGTVTYGVFLASELIAVVKFAPPIRQGVANTLGVQSNELLELDRFCIHPSRHKKNFASFIMKRVIRQVKTDFPHVRKLVSFADPHAGHSGHIYKASNWTYDGKTSSSYYYEDRDGNAVNKKTLYQWAKKHGMKERECFEALGYARVSIPAKFKYHYSL